jgi:hypothetical protein
MNTLDALSRPEGNSLNWLNTVTVSWSRCRRVPGYRYSYPFDKHTLRWLARWWPKEVPYGPNAALASSDRNDLFA